MKIKTLTLSIPVLAFSFLQLSSPILAIDRLEKMQAKITSFQEKKEERKEKICTKISDRADKLISSFTNSEESRKKNHQNSIDRISKIITKLDTMKVDTTKLKSDLATMTQKRDAWLAAYTELVSKLKATKTLECGTGDTAFKDALKIAKTQRETMHKLNQEFWNFVSTTVTDDIKAARATITPTSKVAPGSSTGL